MLSQSEENYLKAIYKLQTILKKGVSTNAIAKKLTTKASSVTDMIKKLADKELVNYKKYQGVQLTRKGEKIAISIIRKHRLWESFLVEKLNFSWDEVHEIAEQLEHIQSEKLITELDIFLNYPKIDPHGDPIPDKQGNIEKTSNITLSNCNTESQYIFVGVKNTSVEFLQYLDRIQLSIGNSISIVHKESFDGSMTIKTENAILTISAVTANNIFIKII